MDEITEKKYSIVCILSDPFYKMGADYKLKLKVRRQLDASLSILEYKGKVLASENVKIGSAVGACSCENVRIDDSEICEEDLSQVERLVRETKIVFAFGKPAARAVKKARKGDASIWVFYVKNLLPHNLLKAALLMKPSWFQNLGLSFNQEKYAAYESRLAYASHNYWEGCFFVRFEDALGVCKKIRKYRDEENRIVRYTLDSMPGFVANCHLEDEFCLSLGYENSKKTGDFFAIKKVGEKDYSVEDVGACQQITIIRREELFPLVKWLLEFMALPKTSLHNIMNFKGAEPFRKIVEERKRDVMNDFNKAVKEYFEIFGGIGRLLENGWVEYILKVPAPSFNRRNEPPKMNFIKESFPSRRAYAEGWSMRNMWKKIVLLFPENERPKKRWEYYVWCESNGVNRAG